MPEVALLEFSAGNRALPINMENEEEQHIQLFIGNHQHLIHGTWNVLIPGPYIFWNQQGFRIHGLVVEPKAYFKINEASLLIHPEDVETILQECEKLTACLPVHSYFRIILPSGEIRIIYLEAESELHKNKKIYKGKLEEEVAYHMSAGLTEVDTFAHAVTSHAEQFMETGTWQINLHTHQTLYSPNVYRIYGVIPGSLQPHPDTFKKFIHPEEKLIVTEALDKVLKELVPLHLEYRIVTETNETKYVKQISRIFRNEKGENLIIGVIQDVTENKQHEIALQEARESLAFHNEILFHLEKCAQTGYWQLNLHTRKIIYSDIFYRLHGLKPQQTPTSYDQLLNYTYPEDREMVAETIHAMLDKHIPPQLTYRIFRTDGKLRCLHVSGKIVVNAEKEQVMIVAAKDVTEEQHLIKTYKDVKQNDALLTESLAQQEEAAGIGNWRLNIKTGQTYFSDNFYRLFGLKPQAHQTDFEQFIHPDDKKNVKGFIRKLFTDDWPASRECRIIAADGQLRHLHLENKMMPSGDGGQVLAGMVHDITSETELRKALENQISFTTILSDSMRDKYMVTDRQHNIVSCNKLFAQQHKVKPDVIKGCNLFDVLPSMKYPAVIDNMNLALTGQPVYVPDYRYFAKNEYLDVHVIPLKDRNNVVTGILSIFNDITPESILKEQLTKRLQFIESLIEKTINRVIVLDENLNFLLWNKKCEEHFALSKSEVLGKNVLEIFPTFKKNKTYEDCKLVLSGQTVFVPVGETTLDKGYYEQYLVPLRDEDEKVYGILWIVHDYTNEYMLTQEYRKAQNILDAINEGCFELDCENHAFRYFNAKGLEMLALPAEELMGKRIWDVFPKAVNSQLYYGVLLVCETRTPFQKEYYSELLGKWIFLKITVSVGGIVVLILDMQAKKDAEDKVQEGFEQWHALVENVPDVILRWNKDLRLIYANHAFEVLTGVPVSSQLNKSSKEIKLPKGISTSYTNALVEACRSGKSKEYYKYFSTSYSLSYFYVRVIPEFAADGSVQSVLTIARDIIRQKNAEEALLKSEHFAEQLACTIPDVIYILDLPSKRLLYINRLWATFLQAPAEKQKAIRSDFLTAIHPDDVIQVTTYLLNMNTAADGEIREIQYRVVNADNEVRWLWDRDSVFKRNAEGTPVHKLSISRDITDSRKSQHYDAIEKFSI